MSNFAKSTDFFKFWKNSRGGDFGNQKSCEDNFHSRFRSFSKDTQLKKLKNLVNSKITHLYSTDGISSTVLVDSVDRTKKGISRKTTFKLLFQM